MAYSIYVLKYIYCHSTARSSQMFLCIQTYCRLVTGIYHAFYNRKQYVSGMVSKNVKKISTFVFGRLRERKNNVRHYRRHGKIDITWLWVCRVVCGWVLVQPVQTPQFQVCFNSSLFGDGSSCGDVSLAMFL